MTQLQILYLDREQVLELGVLDMKAALEDVEETLRLEYLDEAIVPDKVAMGFGKSFEDESDFGRINAMPGYLGGKYHMAGIKWIGSNPKNLQKGMPRASAITILNDPDTKFPLCILDGTEISAMRTGASGGVAAKYLARKNAKTLLLVGAGHQNTTQLEAIYISCPTLKNFFICDINEALARQFADEMGKKLGISITPITTSTQCPIPPDITVNTTSAKGPVIDPSVVGPGCLHLCIGGPDHPDLYRKADKIVCDCWQQVRHRGSCYLAKDGLKGIVTDADIYAEKIGEIICGKKPGRESDSEIIYYKPVGMGIEDISVATRLYHKALETQTGTPLRYW